MADRAVAPCGCAVWFAEGELHVEPCGQRHAHIVQAAARDFAAQYGVPIQYDDGSIEIATEVNLN